MQARSLWGQNKILSVAFAVSIGVHAVVLAVRFVDAVIARKEASDSTLEIVLVNAKSSARPTKPTALAQANLDGGGANDEGSKKSPLPNTFELRDGDTLEQAQQTVDRLEQEQRELLAQLMQERKSDNALPKQARVAAQDAAHAEQKRQQLARMQAEISKQISDYQKRPRKHYFMPSTSEYRFARYVEEWRARIEKIGNEHYPDEARGRIYGTLRMTVSVRRDGSLIEAAIDQSSGSEVLDRAARRIVKLAAPYPPFPPEIGRDTDVLEITRTWIFTNDQFATRALGAGSTTPTRAADASK